MTAPDQTNAEVSDERLREIIDAVAGPFIAVPDATSIRLPASELKALVLELITRRFVTSQASEGAEFVGSLIDQIEQFYQSQDYIGTGSPTDEEIARAEAADAEEVKRLRARATTLYASPSKRVERLETPTHRHVKRGSEYVLIGYGKMQAENWADAKGLADALLGIGVPVPPNTVDMREVAIYRSVDDGSLWVRPREEFEDGRFQALPFDTY